MKKKTLKWLTSSGFKKLAYCEWNSHDNEQTLICAHGLTRNARDFDFIARALEENYRVICPDFPGRGSSDWLEDKTQYDYPTYLQAFSSLLARLDCSEITWLGTSMGGLAGMMLAATAGSPISRLILNDVGPLIPASALAMIAEYVGKQPEFESIEQLEQYLRTINAGFGPLTDEQWLHLAVYSHRKLKNGKVTLSYDPDIAEPFKKLSTDDIDLWPVWNALSCPVLVIRGENSPLLTRETVEKMATRPKTETLEIKGCAHAPALMSELEITQVNRWLSDQPVSPEE